MKVGYLTGR